MDQYEDIKARIIVLASGHGEAVALPLGEVKIWRSPLPMGGPLAPPAGDADVVAWAWKAGAHYGPTMLCTREQAWRHALDLYNAQADAAAAGLTWPVESKRSPDDVIAELRARVADLERELAARPAPVQVVDAAEVVTAAAQAQVDAAAAKLKKDGAL